MRQSAPLLFAIKRYALHDGPNIRTTVFFKGCPLSCFWCHNPEGMRAETEVVTISERCIGCRECVHSCPEGALTLDRQGLRRDEARCTTCLECVEICPALAHEAVGYYSGIDEVMREVEKDLPFYDQSGGGVTFSGGEPLQQAEPLLALLKRCGMLGIHRVVDTSGLAPTAVILMVARHTELFLYDLKHMDSHRHQEYTGVDNTLILANLQALAQNGAAFRIRIPLLAGINDSNENIEATARFARGLTGLAGIDILPYHHFASAKYTKLKAGYRGERSHCPTREDIARVRNILEHSGHQVTIGG
jgi:pyruvate formate lyase activating enzyme